PRRGLPRQRLGHRQRQRCADKDVRRCDERRFQDDSPRARTQLLSARVRRPGAAIALSVTPEDLVKVGLLDKPPDASGDIGLLLQQALEKLAFLPFGLVVDQWRWQVFNGSVQPDRYNAAWWELRERYQGVRAPSVRGEELFDPGAKYHVPANTPYARYFLASVLQFQFHRALSKTAGCTTPLHRCSIYSSKEAGQRLNATLAIGASKPWPDALEALTGERQMDASAIADYFAPLKAWLD